ncbi:MAG: GntR family transcriptional regulator [Spirochaetes bacterium]|nr:GntR family transcriptional regulator [Spirochaetota bacterium]
MKTLIDNYKPKYLQLVDIIRGDILSGRLKEGDKILSENEMKKMYDVSSTTVRKCIDILKNDGLISRYQGVGTFVKAKHVERSLKKVLSFTKNMEQVGLIPSTDVLEKKVIGGFGKYLDKLEISEGTSILRLKRLRYGSGIPMLLETRYINLQYCPAIMDHDLSGSLYQIYEEGYGIKLLGAKQHLRIVFLTDEEAGLLHCGKSNPAYLVTGVTYSDNMLPMEYEESLYRGDEYEFFIEVGF